MIIPKYSQYMEKQNSCSKPPTSYYILPYWSLRKSPSPPISDKAQGSPRADHQKSHAQQLQDLALRPEPRPGRA